MPTAGNNNHNVNNNKGFTRDFRESLVKSPNYSNPFESRVGTNNNSENDDSDADSFEFHERSFDENDNNNDNIIRNNNNKDSRRKSGVYNAQNTDAEYGFSQSVTSPTVSEFSFSQREHFDPGNFEPPRKNLTSKHQINTFGLGSLKEDESVVSFNREPMEYSLSEVGTTNGSLSDASNHLARNGTIMKKSRWGTQRHKSGKPKKPVRAKTLRWKQDPEGMGRKNTFKKTSVARKSSGNSEKHWLGHQNTDNNINSNDDDNKDEKNRSSELRNIYFNSPLPREMVDDEGLPIVDYARNKIKTTKYTPLTFIPKNLYLQFANIANIYFLVLIILGFFSIFGVPNPGLSTVPLIVIVCLTAIKDAIEDSRRTGSDMELNNTITHILKGIDNPNVSTDNVSLWRRFKKLNSRLLFRFIGFSKSLFNEEIKEQRRLEKLKKEKKIDDGAIDQRKSFESFETQAPYNNGKSIPMEELKSVRTSDTTFISEQKPTNPFAGPSVIDKSLPTNGRARFEKGYWKEIGVGDIIRIHNNDEIPADVVILSTADGDGACYVETKNLDGETNLKVRQSLKCTADLKHSVDCEQAKFWVESEGPHANLYSYQGVFKYHNDDGEVVNDPININNMLLRGCSLRNTKWVIGMVIFTGDDTKIMLNAGVTPTKVSRISRELNFSVLLNFALLFVLCIIAGIVNGVYYNKSSVSRDYYEFGTIASTPTLNGIVTFFVAVILYQSLVPISLYISIEIIKTAQAFFIYSDVKMYYDKLDFPCTPKSWTISDDLGQIEYIFSDKTGTLTQNVMEFKKCSINGVSYGKAYTEALAGLRKRQGIDVETEGEIERAAISNDKEIMINELHKLGKNSQLIEDEITFISSEFVKDLQGNRGDEQKRATEHFMLCLALCHSVLAEPDKKHPGRIALKAQSPDESALVGTSRDVGFAFISRTKKGVILEVHGVQKEFQILNTLEFNSTRKRMSAIIKIPAKDPNGKPKALLICKGADSIIYGRLKKESDQKLLEKTALHLEQYATEGLRTLCISHKEIEWDEYLAWNKLHEDASAAIEGREEKMEEVADQIERELILLGGTAIEDRLQDGVSDSIALLGRAGIKLWVLTGDKVETAINIGFSCNLLNNDMDLLVIKDSGEDAEKLSGERAPQKVVAALIDKYLQEKFSMTGSMEELHYAKDDHNPPTGNFGLIIDGSALKIALNSKLRMKFLLLCKRCKAVLCCRVSPAQKAAVVTLVKETLDVMTLAIGDGSNDVAMIQSADVGVGIAGEEGRQAVMSSDYAVGQFRFLVRLLLVHGRWSYKRLAEMIPCFFFKNVIFTLALFWFGIYSNFDGSYLFEYTYLMFYNLAFTSLPVILLGVFDQDVSDVISLLVPQLYRSGILRSEWSPHKFLWYMFDALYQSVISFFFPYLVYCKGGFIGSNGLTLIHRYWMGSFVVAISASACDIYILMHQYRWDWISLLFCSLSILVIFGWTGVWSSSTYSGEFYKSAAQIYGATSFWACFFIGIVICLLPRFSYDSLQRLLNPKDIDIIRECAARGDFSQYPDDYDPTDLSKKKISKYSQDAFTENQMKFNDSADIEVGTYLDDDSRSVHTQEIQMDYIDNSGGKKNLTERIANSATGVFNRNKGKAKSRGRTSLDFTRSEMLGNDELEPTMSYVRGRASLDIPGVNVANQLIATRSRSNNQ
ncbi:aminophospholipid-translocating P4-type ATPase [Saccharomycopsis crataegensis]|uniref:Phospholipid-transporting ATPase n=1 Tax=Saccharomycopsis crataegensis TaxID=43959 RepID=A0AAV5QP86_9ASCO|nr:aminophospholipid-translocating P4-type ATPase [Saccharomycopsis crataegensis]